MAAQFNIPVIKHSVCLTVHFDYDKMMFILTCYMNINFLINKFALIVLKL